MSNLVQSSSQDMPNSPNDKSKDWSEVECMFRLKEFCKHHRITLSHDMVFRFACFHSFDFEAASKAIKKSYTSRFLYLRMDSYLVEQMQETIVFPLPGLKTKDNKSEVLYYRQSRFMPSEARNQRLVDNICYVLNDMSQTEEQCRNGVVVVLNTKGFIDGRNHNEESISLFARALQGKLVPTKVRFALFVGATKRFENSWAQIKELLSPDYVKRFRFISEDKLQDYLMDGYEQYLPDELKGGCRDCIEIAEDYSDLKSFQERSQED
mmetsp:Transcript_35597/g.86220  ORF Transcript_35597/g.86220 Transcript_35597/m.86220 type:complete len:266 (+) Transcript_35597:19-816(+)